MVVVVENPDGPIFVGVSPENPYKDAPNVEDGEEKEQVSFGETVFLIPNRYVGEALELEKHAKFVRFLTNLDVFLNVFDFIITGRWVFIFVSIVSMYGYQGALTYDRTKLIGYIIYQCVLTVGKCGLFISAMTFREFNQTTCILLPLLALLQSYIFYYVIRFYRMLPNFGTSYIQV